mmetsp:Transcript_664/g.994  ORF Transcript_664/g.994 Transcript_664/m.994 type:complete len:484 (+) Transcript_664:235-1686(+)|eukprot:CAMPEP_0119115640 /NCGR_PEP_ID=MMETSP1180-20130426/51684_1 /TAXON_ID=3052 ORGANISM="Chlamydomonas cf sp, Strain CCMP681" /NCGR_SAMPLE_ID=MMETSP1180 /ASSEMBLY_ACC=CAM_ASM_000741 /LENGTH=483 /DNA_ID=CAMNT_0007104715 /DNA_START=168 /DNA_END=1619 /DNA_ORIENTATION=-
MKPATKVPRVPQTPPSIEEWFSTAQRVSCRFFADVSDADGRIEHVSTHLMNELVDKSQSRRQSNSSRHSSSGALTSIPASYQTVTFLHGYPTCSYDFYPLIRRLLDTRQIVARLLLIDMLGFGDSDKGKGEARCSIQQHANVVQSIWDKFDITQSHLVVHGVGVSVAQELLTREPKGRLDSCQLGKIIWLNGSVFHDLYRTPKLQQALMRPLTGWIAARSLSAQSLASELASWFSKQRPASKQFLSDAYTSLRHRKGKQIQHKLCKFMKEQARYRYVWQGALELAMRADPARMLFIWGMQDPLAGSQIAAELHNRYDKYGLKIHEHWDLGHWPHVEDPERVADAIAVFLLEPYVPRERVQQRVNSQDGVERTDLSRVSVLNGVLRSSIQLQRRRLASDADGSVSDGPTGSGAMEEQRLSSGTAVEGLKAPRTNSVPQIQTPTEGRFGCRSIRELSGAGGSEALMEDPEGARDLLLLGDTGAGR